MLHVTRSDHGAAHSGKFAAYVRVSTDKQDVVNQEHAIKAYLNGGDYKEPISTAAITRLNGSAKRASAPPLIGTSGMNCTRAWIIAEKLGQLWSSILLAVYPGAPGKPYVSWSKKCGQVR